MDTPTSLESLLTPASTRYDLPFDDTRLPLSTAGFRGAVQEELPWDDGTPIVPDYQPLPWEPSSVDNLAAELDAEIIAARSGRDSEQLDLLATTAVVPPSVRPCTACKGSGTQGFFDDEVCFSCHGDGEELIVSEEEEEDRAEYQDQYDDIFGFKGEDDRLYYNR